MRLSPAPPTAAARKVAKRRRQKLNAAYVGCVTSGCCSVYTLRFYGCLVVIASAVVTYIMSYVNDHVTIVIGKATELLEQLDEIALLEGPAGDAAHVLPPSDIDSVRRSGRVGARQTRHAPTTQPARPPLPTYPPSPPPPRHFPSSPQEPRSCL